MRSSRWGTLVFVTIFVVAWFLPLDAEARGGGRKRKSGKTRVTGNKNRKNKSSRASRRRRAGTRSRPSTSAAAGRSRSRARPATQRSPRTRHTASSSRNRNHRQKQLAHSPRVRFREKKTTMVNGKPVTVTKITQPGGPAAYRSGSRTRQLKGVMSNREILAAQNVRETVRAAEAKRKLKGKMPADPRDRR